MIELTNHIVCREFSGKRKIVVVSENNMEYRLMNESAFIIEKWKIDRCILKKETACDYLVIKKADNNQEAYWIELKGSDIEQAAYQILTTVGKIKIENTFVHHARIISSKNPNPKLRGTKYRELENFIRNKKGTIINKNRQLKEII
jgi:hypothetical protein